MPGTRKSMRQVWLARRQKDGTRADNIEREESCIESSVSSVANVRVNNLGIDELVEIISNTGSEVVDEACFQRAIELVSEIDGVARQKEVLTVCMRKLLRGKEPKEQQVRSLRRLVFGLGDTLLLAKTGFGKSIIFHAYSILTGKITIQLVPLSKLGEEQVAEINKYGVSGTKACLVSHETKEKNGKLIGEIRQGNYTHIVTSPEQVAMDWFLELVRDVDFRDRIGLVAIDECHLVSTWAGFREAYAKVFTLRANLLPSVVWFGCTATLTREQEAEVLRFGGFRMEGRRPGELEIIRTSIDRPDISFHFLPIPPKTYISLQGMRPLLDQAVLDVPAGGNGAAVADRAASGDVADSSSTARLTMGKEPTPQNIPKTIVFIDGRTKVANVAQAMIDQLVLMGYSIALAARIVEGFHSFTPDHDKDRIFNEFRKPDSHIRILVATTAVGLGMNLPDIERVVLYGLLITMDLSDLMQRIGRAARAANRTGDALIFLPYWLFWDYGEDKPGQAPLPEGKEKKRGKRGRNKPVRGKAAVGDGAAETIPTSGGEETDSDDPSRPRHPEQVSSSQSHGQATGSRREGGQNNEKDGPTPSHGRWCERRKYWTKDEREKRSKVNPEWFEVVNAGCHRHALMKYFREDDADNRTKEGPPPAGRCCNGSSCEGKMTSYDSWPLRKSSSVASGVRKPSSGIAAVALEKIRQWCVERAAELAGPMFFADAPAWLVLSPSIQAKVANTFRPPRRQKKSDRRCPINSVDDLREVVSLADWGPALKYEQEFVDFLIREFSAIQEEHATARAKSKGTGSATQAGTTKYSAEVTEADDFDKLEEELAENPDDLGLRDRVDNQQSKMVTMFRCRHKQSVQELAMRPSTMEPPVQSKSFMPSVQPPRHAVITADPNEEQINVGVRSVEDLSGHEGPDDGGGVQGETSDVAAVPTTPVRCVGQKRAIGSPPSISRARPTRKVRNSSPGEA